MKRLTAICATMAGILAVIAPAHAFDKTVVSITLPDDYHAYKAGPNQEFADSFCSACHAADYVYMQPPLSQKQWEGEVSKMAKVFKCPIEEDKMAPIVEYLMSQNSAKQ